MDVGRPVLLGLDNPVSGDQAHALLPYPYGCSGHRLLQLLQLADPEFTETDYLRYFDRRNLSSTFPAPTGKQELHKLWLRTESECRSRIIVAMGKAVLMAADISKTVPAMTLVPRGMVQAAWIPHPSGRNRYYNDAENRLKVGKFLRSLVRRG